MPTPSDIQEIQLWMPNGDQGQGNLPSLQEFIDSAIRRDGALYGSIAECTNYNKILSQLSRVAVALAGYIAYNGIPVRDTDTAAGLTEKLAQAIQTSESTSFLSYMDTASFEIDSEGNLLFTFEVP